MSPVTPTPDIENDEDGQSWWLGPLDVRADPTGRVEYHAVFLIDDDRSQRRLTPSEARQLGAILLAAADVADGVS